MTERVVHLTFSSPESALERTLTVDAAVSYLAQNLSPRDLQDALTFLEMERMAEGYYKGSNWSVSFRAVEPR